MPSHYLNQCWDIVNWTLKNKLQWNLNQNTKLFIRENALENVIWKMAAMLSQPQCVDVVDHYWGSSTVIWLLYAMITHPTADSQCSPIKESCDNGGVLWLPGRVMVTEDSYQVCPMIYMALVLAQLYIINLTGLLIFNVTIGLVLRLMLI